jgi:hypothetical protein
MGSNMSTWLTDNRLRITCHFWELFFSLSTQVVDCIYDSDCNFLCEYAIRERIILTTSSSQEIENYNVSRVASNSRGVLLI